MNCKNCGKEPSGRALHFSNQIAIKEGYCWIGCMMKKLGKEEALKIVQKHLKIVQKRKNIIK